MFLVTEKGLKLKCKALGFVDFKDPIKTELVFTTSPTGYQESITDPSYKYQTLIFTNPLIGNYGINEKSMESDKVHLDAIVINQDSISTSHHESEEDLINFMKKYNKPILCDLNTRQLVKHIREHGQMKAIISHNETDYTDFEYKKNHVNEVSTKEMIHIKGENENIAVIDYGIKRNIINSLKKYDFNIYIFPYNTSIDEIKKINPRGILLSNGPGDPKEMLDFTNLINEFQKEIPLLGICMGHQVFALANGAKTQKMLFGNRGANQPVHDLEKDRVFITSQNHGYEVEKLSLKNTDLQMTQINLNDQSIEGLKHKSYPARSYQYHPEAAPGPEDTQFIFKEFVKDIRCH